jgi:hypothetical protein
VILVLVVIIVAARLFAALEEIGVPLGCSMELGGRVGVVLRSLVDISSDAGGLRGLANSVFSSVTLNRS